MFQNAGEKGVEHPDPDDPPRPRANRRRGHGTFANDRPPVAGMVGRESGEIRLEVVESASADELDEFVDRSCLSGTTVNTDEWCGYNRVGGHHDRIHVTVDHSGPRSTYAIDADGDGVREVHCNTMEGTWTGLRNFLRPFRGVSKWCASQYVAIFEWGHNVKEATDDFLENMLGSWAGHRIHPMSHLLCATISSWHRVETRTELWMDQAKLTSRSLAAAGSNRVLLGQSLHKGLVKWQVVGQGG